ncbi:alcohol dehydrogenase AdhP [Terriglobus roseus]|uniref:alcohol dehydrogenase n=1 Tax=Terriglobus roseus TaxID=392734 RepID=A0A1G7KZ72_9BACT|nr:alcohol dehydrogenase AdhP [Terriglobus roseus]SDF42396.1 alcohol dehydrogenase, propanol-preferring [Terriglobus roseus]
MAKTMKAAAVRQFGSPLSLEEVPVPAVGPGQALLKVMSTGVCHTDLHAANGDWPVKPAVPFIPGHEGAGYVAAVGAGVKGLREGDRVGVPWLYSACGVCEYCLKGWETLCPYQKNSGYSVNGSFAEYVLVNPSYIAHLPPKIGFSPIAPILCAGVTVYKGLKETDVKPGQWVAISGIGGLGHLAVQYAKAMGMHIVALDVAQDKLDLAKKLGAEITVDVNEPEVAGKVIAATGGGVHGALITAVSPAAFSLGVNLLRRMGTMSLVGLPPGEFPVSIFDMVLQRKTLRGSIVGTRMDMAECLDFAARGLVKSTYSTEALENINSIFDRMIAGTIDGRIVMEIASE